MAHSFIEFRKTLPSPGAPTKIGIAISWQVASRPRSTPICFSAASYNSPELEPQLRAGHRALEFGTQERGGQEAILIQQHVLVERHVGDANGALITQRAVVAPDRNFENGIAMLGKTAMAVVITDRVGGTQVGDPAGFQQRQQPRLMLAGDGDGTRDRERQRAAHADRRIENGVDAAKECSAECRKAVRQDLVERVAFVDASNFYRPFCRVAPNFFSEVVVWFHSGVRVRSDCRLSA